MEDKFGETRKKQKSTKVEKQEKTGGPYRGHLNKRSYRKKTIEKWRGGKHYYFPKPKALSC